MALIGLKSGGDWGVNPVFLTLGSSGVHIHAFFFFFFFFDLEGHQEFEDSVYICTSFPEDMSWPTVRPP